jgi:hypothetical protein
VCGKVFRLPSARDGERMRNITGLGSAREQEMQEDSRFERVE